MTWTRTTYSDGHREYEAVLLPWPEVTRILGGEHTGAPDEDRRLVAYLLEAGAPEWVRGADGWIDEDGWGLIGPQLLEGERDYHS